LADTNDNRGVVGRSGVVLAAGAPVVVPVVGRVAGSDRVRRDEGRSIGCSSEQESCGSEDSKDTSGREHYRKSCYEAELLVRVVGGLNDLQQNETSFIL
jgi:hypothetical protein